MKNTDQETRPATSRSEPSATTTSVSDANLAHRTLLSRVARRGTLVAAVGALAFIAYACSKHEDEQPVASAERGTPAVTAEQRGAGPTFVGSAVPVQNSSPSEIGSVASADSLPPEVVASGPDTLVTPGQVIEIVANGSADVSSMVLSDRVGHKQSFVYDPSAGAWRTFYRVPMRIPTERLELSVTAKNDRLRWRRVWVFAELNHGEKH